MRSLQFLFSFQRIIVFGNSGSGKSTLAKRLASDYPSLAHLDLDTIAWQANSGVPQRKPLPDATSELDVFCLEHTSWVMEGCYADLLSHVAPEAELAIYLNLSAELCQENAQNRPWEPHKYPTKEAQDANLAMLLDWIADYETREDDSFSRAAHERLWKGFQGQKVEVTTNLGIAD